ncbi:MAG: hypothetical protein AAF403_01915, partial [Pseudomonadota bacterium]
PDHPANRLEVDQIEKIKQFLIEADFFSQPPYQANHRVEDGGFYIVTAKIGDQQHEIIYEAVISPIVRFLAAIDTIP